MCEEDAILCHAQLYIDTFAMVIKIFSLNLPTDHSIMEVTTIPTITGILILVWMDGYAETTETVPGSIQT